MEQKLFIDNIDDHINELGRIRLPKNINTFIKIQFKRLDQGECLDTPTISLTQALGLNQPVNSLKIRSNLDVYTYSFLSRHMLDDVNTFWRLMFNGHFDSHLRAALGFAQNVKMMYDGVKKALCIFSQITNPDQEPIPLEMQLSEVEKKVTQAMENSSKLSKEQLKQALEGVQNSLERIKVDNPTQKTVQDMINSAFRNSVTSMNKAIQEVVNNPRGLSDTISTKILKQVEGLITNIKKDVVMTDQVSKLLDEALDQVNDTIMSQIQTITDNPDNGFYKLSLLDLILAITSIILASIAIINSICLCVMSSRKKQNGNDETYVEGFNMELTPMLERRDPPEGDNARDYSVHSSVDTAPSPQPATRRAHFD